MERFSKGLRSPLLFWECILVPAELINYKPNILLATTLHISLATSTASTQLCCEVVYLYGCMGYVNMKKLLSSMHSEDSYYRLLPCHSLLKLSWYIILKYFRVYFHSLLIALICIIIYLRIAWIQKYPSLDCVLRSLCMSPVLWQGPCQHCLGLYHIYYLLSTTHHPSVYSRGIGSWWLVAQYAECCYIVKYYQSHFKVDMLQQLNLGLVETNTSFFLF